MDSAVVRLFENINWDVGNIPKWKNIVYISLVVTCLIIFLKYTLMRQKYSKIFPCRPMRWTDIWGNVYDYVYQVKTKGISPNVYILQIFMGYDQLFKKEKLFQLWLAYFPVVVLTKAEAVEEFLSGSKHLNKFWTYRWFHPWLGTGILTSEGSKWKSRRKLLTPSLHFEILKNFIPIFNEQSQLLVKLMKKETEKPWTDIVKLLTLCSLDIVCETILGVSIGAQKNTESEYVQALERACGVMMSRLSHPPYFMDWYFSLSSVGVQFKKDVKLIQNFTRAVIAEKKQKLLSTVLEKKKKRRALIDLLLDEHIQNQTLTEEDIQEEVDTFAFAGHDSTTMGMSWILYLIGLYKDVQEIIHEEIYHIFGDDCERPVTTDDIKNMAYLDRVFKESQRLYPPVPLFVRQLKEDATLCGFKVPKGNGVAISPYLLHRDEKVFPNPEKFDPDRFLPENTANRHPYAYIPFSAGPRNCMGQRFAMLEEKVVVTNILRNYSLESLDPRDRVIPIPEVVLRPAVPIRLKITPRTVKVD